MPGPTAESLCLDPKSALDVLGLINEGRSDYVVMLLYATHGGSSTQYYY